MLSSHSTARRQYPGRSRMQEELGHGKTGNWYRDGNRPGLDRGDPARPALVSRQRVSDATTKFSPRDTIYAVALTQGSSPNATVTARWTYEEGGQVVKEDSRSIAANGTEATEFHISKPSGWPKGKYRVTLTLGGSTESKDFEVK